MSRTSLHASAAPTTQKIQLQFPAAYCVLQGYQRNTDKKAHSTLQRWKEDFSEFQTLKYLHHPGNRPSPFPSPTV
jgi:hypothetical protein